MIYTSLFSTVNSVAHVALYSINTVTKSASVSVFYGQNLSTFFYIVASVLFIFSLNGLSSKKTTKNSALITILGIFLCLVFAILNPIPERFFPILFVLILGGGIGGYIAQRVQTAALPQFVAGFHSLVGLSALCVSVASFYSPQMFHIGTKGNIHTLSLIAITIGTILGAVTFTGSIFAFLKLKGIDITNFDIFDFLKKNRVLKDEQQNKIQEKLNNLPLSKWNETWNKRFDFFGLTIPFSLLFFKTLCLIFLLFLVGTQASFFLWGLILASCFLGIFFIRPIPVINMPILISLLNSYSGWAAVAIGFMLSNLLLIITGAIIGFSGLVLSFIMCKNLNKSLLKAMLESEDEVKKQENSTAQPLIFKKEYHTISVDEAVLHLKEARSIIVMLNLAAIDLKNLNTIHEMIDFFKKAGTRVHVTLLSDLDDKEQIDTLLSKIDKMDMFDLKAKDFPNADIVLIIEDHNMTPHEKVILDIDKDSKIFMIKPPLEDNIFIFENDLFYQENVSMLFGNPQEICSKLIEKLKKIQ